MNAAVIDRCYRSTTWTPSVAVRRAYRSLKYFVIGPTRSTGSGQALPSPMRRLVRSFFAECLSCSLYRRNIERDHPFSYAGTSQSFFAFEARSQWRGHRHRPWRQSHRSSTRNRSLRRLWASRVWRDRKRTRSLCKTRRSTNRA